ncbi:MAG: GNAT family N-acetyltransferase [Caulobacter sp.]|nr:GNAT family N-acetyltransferase [Caulobacter sp.]
MAEAPEASSGQDLQVRRFGASDVELLAAFFGEVAQDPASDRFHPHPFTAEAARRIAEHQGRDLYLGQFLDGQLVGYGMLRGWDEGYETPSLGIYLSARVRGQGLAKALMEHLHRQARQNGADRIRLKVYKDNLRAVTLYQGLGYVFVAEEGEQSVGLLDLISQGGGL